jgi:predicted enzyme related to lactoylglutathione lyase
MASQHPIVHIEISANNLDEATKFYQRAFGWVIESIPEMGYATFVAEGGPGGGLNPVTADNPAGTVLVYVDTDDIAGDLQRIESLGGKTVVPKTEIPGFGWFGVFADPTGNHIGLFTALPGM